MYISKMKRERDKNTNGKKDIKIYCLDVALLIYVYVRKQTKMMDNILGMAT